MRPPVRLSALSVRLPVCLSACLFVCSSIRPSASQRAAVTQFRVGHVRVMYRFMYRWTGEPPLVCSIRALAGARRVHTWRGVTGRGQRDGVAFGLGGTDGLAAVVGDGPGDKPADGPGD